MKKFFIYILLLLLFASASVMYISYKYKSSSDSLTTFNGNSLPSEPFSVSLYLVDQDKIITLDFEDYILGLVSNEISPDYCIETIKAQTVAIRSFVLNKLCFQDKEDIIIKHKGANLCDGSHCIKWFPFDKSILQYDSNSLFENKTKYQTALSETQGEYIEYNNTPATTFWHKISHGRTENSLDILEIDYPYHKSVLSESDKFAPGYISRVIYPTDAFNTIMKGLNKDAVNIFSANNIIGDVSSTPGGSVLTVQINNKTYTGQEIKNAFKLKSAFFTIEVDEYNVIFEVRGDGHNIGMSQYGANIMAENSFSYKDIIYYYYPGAILSSLNHIA